MPWQARESSGTGIYHVMMRGVNHQNIFQEQEDYYQFLNTLDMMAQSYELDRTPAGRNYILYAYCLMSNHIHLLIRERKEIARFRICPREKKYGIQIPQGTWHSIVVHEPSTIFEAKDGAYGK